MSSSAAIEPAIATLPVRNQLIANVSSVPRVRQLKALRTDLVWVSAPRNETTGYAPYLDDDRTYHAGASSCPPDVSHPGIINGHILRIRAFCSGNLPNA